MFDLYADKTKLTLRQREPVTSGSVNVYQARFTFSPDWDGLTKTVVFRASEESRSMLLDETGTCEIPWEVLKKFGVSLYAGVYGTKGEDVVLPTVWTKLGVILAGASPQDDNPPPTPELWEQELAKKGDSLGYTKDGELGLYSGEKLLSSVPIEGGGGSGQDGTTFIPFVSEAGVISWTNDGGLPNPDPVNIKGPVGETGPQGATGNQSPAGKDGAAGPAGKDATINGENAVTLAAGNNVSITTGEDGTVTISASGGGSSGGDVYSTEEQVIGTWIDGKPLYRISCVTTGPNKLNTWVKIYPEVPNAEIVNFDLIIKSSIGTVLRPSDINSNGSILYKTAYGYSGNTGGINAGLNAYTTLNSFVDAIIYFSLYYTKNTDQATIELPALPAAAPAQDAAVENSAAWSVPATMVLGDGSFEELEP